MTGDVRFRRPIEADHASIVRKVDEWWGDRSTHHRLPRSWFRHFTGTSWIAEDGRGRIVAFIVGFVSPDHPDEACIHMIGTGPNHRRRGIGRALYDRFFEDARQRGARRAIAPVPPGERGAIDFHRALGFAPTDGDGTQNLYGTPAFADYDADGADRAVFSRDL